MSRCGTTCDENSVPPWTRGDFRGVLGRETYPPRLPSGSHPSDGGDLQKRTPSFRRKSVAPVDSVKGGVSRSPLRSSTVRCSQCRV